MVHSLAFYQLQAYPMFARFHDSRSPKTIVRIFTLVDLGGNTAALSAKLKDLVLKQHQ